jgi:hypothetical protein
LKLLRSAYAISVACIVLGILPDTTHPNELRDPTRRQLYQTFQQPLLSDSAYVVRDTLQLQLPDLEIKLAQGQLATLRDGTGALTGWLFVGNAHVRFSPRHELERQQLHRFTGDSVLACDVSTILWRFIQPPVGEWPPDGSTIARDPASETKSPWQRLPRAPAKINANAAALPNLLQKALLQRRGFNFATYLLSSKYANPASELAACAFVPDEPRPPSFPPIYLYLHEPAAHEAISFFQYLQKGLGQPLYTVCSYPLENYFSTPPEDSVRLTKYNGWVELNPNGRLTADMGVDIFTARRQYPSFFFQLAADLTVARVTAETGDTLDFIQEKKENGLTVFLPETMAGRDTIRLLFHYDGKILEKTKMAFYF